MPPAAARDRRTARAPRQARSRARHDRILEAAEALVAELGFESASVALVARRAGCSVGAFYARFVDKQALLHALHERFLARAAAQLDASLAPERAERLALPLLLYGVVQALVGIHRRERGLVRALAVEASRDASFQTLRDALALHAGRRLGAVMRARAGEVGHHHPERAVAFGLTVVLGGIENALLFDRLRTAAGLTPSDDDLAAELSRLFRAYLEIPSPA
jgi:AcrR family transcriptional regulator